VLRFLVRGTSPTVGGALVVSLANMSVRREAVLPVPGCEGCRSAPDAAS
jgi:hypothetical protein